MKAVLLILGITVAQSYGTTISSKSLKQSKSLPEITSTCNNIDWSCGDTLTICGSGGPYGNCICAGDMSGHTQCVQDTSCGQITRCSDGGECPSGSVCLNSENCCGIPNCVPLCNNSVSTTTTPMPTTTTTEAPNVCSGTSWQCGGSVKICGNQGPYGECFCGDDVEGNPQCFIDESCSSEPECSQNSECPSGSACVTGTCCEFSLCLPLCINDTTTTTPSPVTPSPTSSSICANELWTCGGSVTECGTQGPLGECFCNEDVNGNHNCVIDDYCSDMAVCSSNSDCSQGSVCAASCCGSGNCFQICSQSKFTDPLSRVLPITAFTFPSAKEKMCAESYLRCRETCSHKFGRCTAKEGKCSHESIECLEQCKEKRRECED